jgi:hypothetical protein
LTWKVARAWAAEAFPVLVVAMMDTTARVTAVRALTRRLPAAATARQQALTKKPPVAQGRMKDTTVVLPERVCGV